MRYSNKFLTTLSLFAGLAVASATNAQLQITEILYDSKTSPEASWEWFEIYNAGDEDLDLDGYILDDRSTAAAQNGPNILSLVGEADVNTVVPAKTAAVVYNASGLEFDESRFQNAWQLNPSVPLIGVDGWQSLNQDGDAFGLWDSLESYQADLDNVDEDEDLEVVSFDNAITSIDYDAEGFPGAPAGSSLQWNGMGDFQDGANWAASEEGSSVLSVATALSETAINSIDDIGNPGTVLGFTDGFNSVAITEIMYNPASAEPDWEWIELYNGTDETIDFSATPYFLDDKASADIPEANVNSGEILAGETAVLFRDGITAEEMEIAWGEGNYIAVGNWPSLNNGGDLIAIWDSADEYALDGEGDGDRIADGAIFSVTYEDGNEDWPNVGQGNSISIIDLSDSADLGINWSLSIDDGDAQFANPVISSLDDHAGGDLGSPGTFGDVDPPMGLDLNGDGTIDISDAALVCEAGVDVEANGGVLGDFNFSGEVDFSDFLILSTNFGDAMAGLDYSAGDVNCSGGVDFSDFLVLSTNFGQSAAESVPEPAAGMLLLVVFLAGLSGRRKR